MIQKSLDKGVIQLLDKNGNIVGTGFLVKEDLAVTCAHVINACGSNPSENVSYRPLRGVDNFTAEVLTDGWSSVDFDDIAFMRLKHTSDLLHPLDLASSSNSILHPYTSLGFPKNNGNIQARRPTSIINGIVPVRGKHDLLELKGEEMDYGMSGAPILDLVLNRVIGMVTFHKEEKYTRLIYATTTDTLKYYLPQLCFSNLSEIEQYRDRVLKETKYVNLKGIPMIKDRQGRLSQPEILLDKIFINLRAVEDGLQRNREEAERKGLERKIRGSNISHSLNDILMLGEYLYQRGIAKNDKELIIIDPQEALNRYNRFVILGAPGSGKSTLLKWISRQALSNLDGHIPIFVPLGEYSSAKQQLPILSLREFALQISSTGDKELYTVLDELASSGKILWLLDALDEAHLYSEQAARESMNLPGQVVITSRPIGFTNVGLEEVPKFEILPLSAENVNEFLTNWFEAVSVKQSDGKQVDEKWVRERIAWLWIQLENRPQLLELIYNPLILTFLAILAGENQVGNLPNSRLELYNNFIERLYYSWEERHSLDHIHTLVLPGFILLGWALHFAYYSGKPSQPPTLESIKNKMVSYTIDGWKNPSCEQVEEVINFWKVAGILEAWRLGSTEYLAFRHQTFQEFASGQALKHAWMLNNKRTWKFLKPRLHIPSWREPILMLFSSLKEKEQAQFLKYLLSAKSPWEAELLRDLRLAIVLICEEKETQDDIHKKVKIYIEKIIASRKNVWKKANLINSFRGENNTFGIQILKKSLNDPLWNIRQEAVKSLGKLGDHEGIKQAFNDENANVRREVVIALAKLGDREGVLNALNDENGTVRQLAAHFLGTMNDWEGLQRAISDKNENVRREAILALEKVNNQVILSNATRHNLNEVRRAALLAMAKIVDAKVLRLFLEDPDWTVRQTTVWILRDLHDIEGLRKALSDVNFYVRQASIRALGRLDDQEGLRVAVNDSCEGLALEAAHFLKNLKDEIGLRQAFQSNFSKVRCIAIQALAQSDCVGLEEELLIATQSYDNNVRGEALKALGYAGNWEVLVNNLKDSDPNIRRVVVEVLGELGKYSYIKQSLADNNSEVRGCAIEILGPTLDRKILIQALDDNDENIKSSVIEILIKKEDKEGLYQALEYGNEHIKIKIIKGLGALGDLGALKKMYTGSNISVRREILKLLIELNDAELIFYLQHALNDKDSSLRIIAVETIGRMKERKFLSELKKLLYDENKDVRSKAIFALGELSDVVELRKSLKKESYLQRRIAIEMLAKLGDRQGIVQALDDVDSVVRKTAIEALGSFGDKKYIPMIRKMLNDMNEGVRWSAIQILEEFGDMEGLLQLLYLNENLHTRLEAAEALSYLATLKRKTKDVMRVAHAIKRQQAWDLLEAIANRFASVSILNKQFDDLLEVKSSKNKVALWALRTTLGCLALLCSDLIIGMIVGNGSVSYFQIIPLFLLALTLLFIERWFSRE